MSPPRRKKEPEPEGQKTKPPVRKPATRRSHRSRAAQQDPRVATAVGCHPDRQVIEMLLHVWPVTKVEIWLSHRYPDRNNVTGEWIGDQSKLRIGRTALYDYRKKFLEPTWDDGWREPFGSSSPIEDVIPPRPPTEGELIELTSLRLAIEAAELTLARCLILDSRSGLVGETTLLTLKTLAEVAEKRAMLAGRLGIPGYELVPEKLQVDQRSLMLHGSLEAKPLEPEKVALARALMQIEPAKRELLMSARLDSIDPKVLVDQVAEHEVITLDRGKAPE